MRIIKEPEVRKNEILDVSEILFAMKGFDKTTVNDILDKAGIAKGTFYYYFKSKEDALDGIVERWLNEGLERAQSIAANKDLGTQEKLLAVIMAQKPQNQAQENLDPVLHTPQNTQLHKKILVQYILRLAPILGDIITEGVKQRIFKTPFPKESAEILLTVALVLFDDGYFQWEPKDMAVKIPAFLCTIERVLGAKPGSFANFKKAFQ